MDLEARVNEALDRERRKMWAVGIDPDDPELAERYMEKALVFAAALIATDPAVRYQAGLPVLEHVFCQDCGWGTGDSGVDVHGYEGDACQKCGGFMLGAMWVYPDDPPPSTT